MYKFFSKFLNTDNEKESNYYNIIYKWYLDIIYQIDKNYHKYFYIFDMNIIFGEIQKFSEFKFTDVNQQINQINIKENIQDKIIKKVFQDLINEDKFKNIYSLIFLNSAVKNYKFSFKNDFKFPNNLFLNILDEYFNWEKIQKALNISDELHQKIIFEIAENKDNYNNYEVRLNQNLLQVTYNYINILSDMFWLSHIKMYKYLKNKYDIETDKKLKDFYFQLYMNFQK